MRLILDSGAQQQVWRSLPPVGPSGEGLKQTSPLWLWPLRFQGLVGLEVEELFGAV